MAPRRTGKTKRTIDFPLCLASLTTKTISATYRAIAIPQPIIFRISPPKLVNAALAKEA